MNETRDLAAFLSELDPRDLPAEVFDRTRYLLLDYLGVAIRGSHAESSAAVYRMIERLNAARMFHRHRHQAPNASWICRACQRHGSTCH